MRALLAGIAVVGTAVMLTSAEPARADIVSLLIDEYALSPGEMPRCDDARVLGQVQRRFHIQATRVHHAPELKLDGVERIRHVEDVPGYKVERPTLIQRRYCQGHARLNDGKHPQVYYLIEQRAGFVGVSWNVEFCMAGYDPWRVHDGNCRTLRPW